MTYESAGSPIIELGSHLYDIRERLAGYTRSVNESTNRLERKCEQLILLPPQKQNTLGADNTISPRLPLLAEIEQLAHELDTAISRLSETISIVETI